METKIFQGKRNNIPETLVTIDTPVKVHANQLPFGYQGIDYHQSLKHILDEWKCLPWFDYLQKYGSSKLETVDVSIEGDNMHYVFRLRWTLDHKHSVIFRMVHFNQWKNCRILRFT